jgi:hypothetical protein
MYQFQHCNVGLSDPVASLHNAECVVRHKMPRPSFAEWMHALAACPHLRVWTGRTPRNVSWCQHTLLPWQARGYPDPGEWRVDMARWLECSAWDILEDANCELADVHKRLEPKLSDAGPWARKLEPERSPGIRCSDSY